MQGYSGKYSHWYFVHLKLKWSLWKKIARGLHTSSQWIPGPFIAQECWALVFGFTRLRSRSLRSGWTLITVARWQLLVFSPLSQVGLHCGHRALFSPLALVCREGGYYLQADLPDPEWSRNTAGCSRPAWFVGLHPDPDWGSWWQAGSRQHPSCQGVKSELFTFHCQCTLSPDLEGI